MNKNKIVKKLTSLASIGLGLSFALTSCSIGAQSGYFKTVSISDLQNNRTFKDIQTVSSEKIQNLIYGTNSINNGNYVVSILTNTDPAQNQFINGGDLSSGNIWAGPYAKAVQKWQGPQDNPNYKSGITFFLFQDILDDQKHPSNELNPFSKKPADDKNAGEQRTHDGTVESQPATPAPEGSGSGASTGSGSGSAQTGNQNGAQASSDNKDANKTEPEKPTTETKPSEGNNPSNPSEGDNKEKTDGTQTKPTETQNKSNTNSGEYYRNDQSAKAYREIVEFLLKTYPTQTNGWLNRVDGTTKIMNIVFSNENGKVTPHFYMGSEPAAPANNDNKGNNTNSPTPANHLATILDTSFSSYLDGIYKLI
ncbi:hypothetical protein [Mycoplasma sp. E35C]|uniref:DUF6856 family protein n=1 Tax=Mycoplasma sp. E35C TaxID=2801918 RepID=UPI001CA388AA|nr:hypothetical protein [Mycoplasma sp. E35C]QZX49277.1 hypothetical protein JJE79_00770 [Mycoplasma sp. E35C]